MHPDESKPVALTKPNLRNPFQPVFSIKYLLVMKVFLHVSQRLTVH